MSQILFTEERYQTLTVQMPVDVSSNTGLSILYRKPDGTKGSWTGVINGTTGIDFTFTTGTELDQTGKWMIQGKANFAGGLKTFGAISILFVHENLEA